MIHPAERKPIAWGLKRVFDRAAAAAALVVGAPVLAGIAAAIRADSPGNPIFTQARIGAGGRLYEVVKFRTMVAAAPVEFNPDGSTKVAARDARVTRVGALLRGGLDELPNLVNVLKGEMSIVGPRPDMEVHGRLYTDEEKDKLLVPPGVTSLAAVLGRNEIPWKTRIAIDLRYIERWSLGLDAKIMLQTLALPLGVRLFDFGDVLGSDLEEALRGSKA